MASQLIEQESPSEYTLKQRAFHARFGDGAKVIYWSAGKTRSILVLRLTPRYAEFCREWNLIHHGARAIRSDFPNSVLNGSEAPVVCSIEEPKLISDGAR